MNLLPPLYTQNLFYKSFKGMVSLLLLALSLGILASSIAVQWHIHWMQKQYDRLEATLQSEPYVQLQQLVDEDKRYLAENEQLRGLHETNELDKNKVLEAFILLEEGLNTHFSNLSIRLSTSEQCIEMEGVSPNRMAIEDYASYLRRCLKDMPVMVELLEPTSQSGLHFSLRVTGFKVGDAE